MGAEEVLGAGVAVFLAIYKNAVGESATLGALAAVRAAAAEVLASEALSRIAHAECAVYKDLQFQVRCRLDACYFLERKLSG